MINDVVGAFVGNEPIKSDIMMIGVGGAGCNIVEEMYRLGIHNVMFMVCNTDTLALNKKSIPLKIVLGAELTNGLGAGADPEVGRKAGLESEELIRQTLIETNTRMAFISAGMGGGTGTGAAPVIARVCQEMGILTVGFVTVPQKNEGLKRLDAAIMGLHNMSEYLDSILIVDNQAVVETYGELLMSKQFTKANEILSKSAKGIAEIITIELAVNVDFADVSTVMRKSGMALLGTASVNISDQENYIDKAMIEVLNSSLLMQRDISGAKDILVNISWGSQEPKGQDISRILQVIQDEAGSSEPVDVIYGAGQDANLGDNELRIVVVATKFGASRDVSELFAYKPKVAVAPQNESVTPLESHQKPTMVISANTVAKKPEEELNTYRGANGGLPKLGLNDRVRIREEHIVHLKKFSISELEDMPAYKRYKMNVKFVPDIKNKIIVKLDDKH